MPCHPFPGLFQQFRREVDRRETAAAGGKPFGEQTRAAADFEYAHIRPHAGCLGDQRGPASLPLLSRGGAPPPAVRRIGAGQVLPVFYLALVASGIGIGMVLVLCSHV